ncbi:hypothetical protein MFIFM68171_09618 [Madurella fahalii]|uniref:DM13 domain-containing protein n=1 Tax=Madurella fahalii TaxID=1157608 RepID=A0ABQ0GNU2_9PEZI
MKSIFTVFALVSAVFQISTAQAPADTKMGWAGELSSLDGGLGGTVVVTDANTLVINDYRLEDASAPALYWWGSTSSDLADGFRISNTQVDEAATSDTYTITLDAGRTTADFETVGLWCERFSTNFGQATLAPSDEEDQSDDSDSSTTAPNAGVANSVGWSGVGAAAVVFAFSLL